MQTDKAETALNLALDLICTVESDGRDKEDERRWHLQVGQIMKELSRRAEAGGVAQPLGLEKQRPGECLHFPAGISVAF